MVLMSTKPLLDEILEQTRIFTTGAIAGLISGIYISHKYLNDTEKKEQQKYVQINSNPNLNTIEKFYTRDNKNEIRK